VGIQARVLRQIDEEYERIGRLLDLYKESPFPAEERLRDSKGVPRNIARLWQDVLIGLEGELKQVIPQDRPQSKQTVSKRVYEVMAEILHFLHPDIWPDHPGMVKRIKDRCYRYDNRD
jgi:hypothetical protein